MSKIKPKECQNVEFKTSWNDKYLEWICGFANAQGAVMYFGVNDDHEVVGLKNTKKQLEDIPNKIVNYMGLVTTQKTTQKNVEKIVENSVEKSVEKVWRLIKQDSYITTKLIADAVGLSIRGIEENIKKLKREGRIRRIGGDNGGHWEVIE